MTLGKLLHSRTIENPAGTVLFCGDVTMSWEELDTSTSRLAGWFLDQGLRSGDRVAIHWPNRLETVQLFFGLWKAGLIAVPINTRLKPAEISHILDHSQARMCFSDAALAPLAAEAGAGNVLSELPRLEATDVTLPEVDPDQPSAILYTSGTTACPKGVTHTHRTLIENSRLIGVFADRLDSSDRFLVITQMMHAAGLLCTLLAIQSGGSAVLIPGFVPAAVLDAIEQFGCTYSAAFPALIHAIAEEQVRKPRDVTSLRTLMVGGDSMPVNLQERVQRLFGVAPQECYGMTEAVPLTANPKGAIQQGSLGVAPPEVQVRVVDLNDCDVPDGETGEMAVRNPGNCIGYWNDPDASRALLRHGWLYTGDLASRDSDGYYWFKGRKKEIIIRGGSNISPQEVEEALYQHPSIMEVGVVGTPEPILGERVIAFVSLRPTDAASEKELIEFARQRLADYKTPERILFIPQLPKGLTGKVQRRALKEMLISQPDLIEKCAVAGI
jgi:long-chain acyl-CoA synthetase